MVGISVIVPVYNVEDLVGRCLESLVNQTFNNFEIIVVNDGTKDDSMRIVNEFEKLNPELIKIIHQENQGLSASRNTGLKHSNGKYIYYIDSDDYIAEDTLKTMFEVAEESGADYVIDGFNTVNENGDFLGAYPVAFDPKNCEIDVQKEKELFLIHNSVWNRLYSKEILDKHQIEFIPGIWYEDLIYTRQYLLYSKKAFILDRQFISYVQREGSLMSSMSSEKNLDIIIVFETLIKEYQKQGVYDDYKDMIERLAIEHFYIAAVVRVSRAGSMDLALRIRNRFIELFPNYKNNPMMKTVSFKHKILLKLIDLKMFKVIKVLFG